MKRIFIIGLSIAILGCYKKEERHNYYPVGIGDKWQYEFIFSTQFKIGLLDSVIVDSADGYVEIVRTDKLTSGEEVYVDSMVLKPKNPNSTFISETTFVSYIKVTEDTIFTYSKKSDTKPSGIEPRSLDIGVSWKSGLPSWLAPESHNLSEDTTATAEVISKEDIKVTVDSFSDCLLVKYTTNTGKVIREWRADNVGIVKMETSFDIPYPPLLIPLSIKGELVSYEIKE